MSGPYSHSFNLESEVLTCFRAAILENKVFRYPVKSYIMKWKSGPEPLQSGPEPLQSGPEPDYQTAGYPAY